MMNDEIRMTTDEGLPRRIGRIDFDGLTWLLRFGLMLITRFVESARGLANSRNERRIGEVPHVRVLLVQITDA